jgi:DNA polymerase-1
MTKKLLLIDAMGLIFRAYYAMIKSPRFTSKGLNTSAMLGFTNSLYEVLKNEKPTHVAVAFDTGAPTFRHVEYEHYKENRDATPDDIVQSIPYIKRILDAFQICMIGIDGYEADDLVGALAKHAEIEGFEVLMLTSDKDYGQLVSDHIKMYKPGKFGQPAEILGVPEICEKYKIERPEQLIDMLGLWGDSSDNIPGVPGIGQVRAQKLLANYGSIEEMYDRNFDKDNEKTRTLMNQYKEQAFLSKELATIMIDIPMEYDFEQMVYNGPDPQKLKVVFDELEFKALTKRIFTDLSLQVPQPQAAPDLFSPIEESEAQTPMEVEAPKTVFEFPQTIEVQSIKDITIKKKETIFFAWIFQQERIAGFAFATDETKTYYHWVESEHRHYQEFIKLIFGEPHTVVMHDCKNTYKFLKSFRVDPKCTFWDVQIAHYLLQPERKHQLSDLALSYFDCELTETGKPSPAPENEQILLLQKLYPLLDKELKENKLSDLFTQMEMPLVPVLANMEYTGVKVDVDTLQQNSDTMNAEIAAIEQQIYDYAGETFNIGSPKQLGEILFEKMALVKNARLTKSKQYQTGEEVLKKMAYKHPIVPLILEWRKLSKLKSTYIDALPQLINPKTGRIHSTFTQTITATGRLSSLNPNLQNIPVRTERGRDIRKAFVPSDGNVLLAADYSQIELRIVAHVCQDERMIETFRNNEDIHATMAAHIYGVDKQDVTADMRRAAKTVNFGILYGISAFGLADRLQIPQSEAKQLITDYFRSFPKISDYLNDTLDFAREHEYVETLMGRRRNIRDINAKNGILRAAAERNAINAPIQGTAADLIKIAMVRIYQAMNERNMRSKMILQVHDELIFDTHPDELETLTDLVREHMSGAMQLSVPLDVNISSGQNWLEAH